MHSSHKSNFHLIMALSFFTRASARLTVGLGSVPVVVSRGTASRHVCHKVLHRHHHHHQWCRSRRLCGGAGGLVSMGVTASCRRGGGASDSEGEIQHGIV